MKIRSTVLRGAAMIAISTTIMATTMSAPLAAASPMQRVGDNDNQSKAGGIGDVPIIGDLVGSFEGQEPEEIAVGAIQLAAGAAEIAVPMVIRLFK